MKTYCRQTIRPLGNRLGYGLGFSLAAALVLIGCSSNEVPQNKRADSGIYRANGSASKFQVRPPGGMVRMPQGDSWTGAPMTGADEANGPYRKNINDYVRGMMHQLVSNLQYVNNQTPIGVSSFVSLDSNLKETSLLGYQLAESFIHEIHQVGIPVIDYKTMDFIRVTAQGDFIFSRDFLELQSAVPIQYILTGTVVKHQGGYLLNARIIGLVSKAVVASAQGFIPHRVANTLIRSDGSDGIMR
ncbi:MAG: TolB-like protein [Phenylobacterium sp.]|jgi:TolB-like protein